MSEKMHHEAFGLLGFRYDSNRRYWVKGMIVFNDEAAKWLYNRPVMDSIVDKRINQSMTSYADYLINDQCKQLLRMDDQGIADVLGVSRPTVHEKKSDPSKLTAAQVDLLERHLSLVKSVILTT